MRPFPLIVIVALVGAACDDGILDSPTSDSGSPIWSQEVFLLAPGWGGDERHFYVGAGGVYALNPENGDVIWESPGGRVGPEFQVIGEVLVVEQGGLKGLRASDGEVLWNQPGAPSGGVIGSVSEGVIISTDGIVMVAHDLGTGIERWRAELEAGGGVNLAVGEGVACAERLSPRGDAVVQCFSALDGALLWTRRMESAGWIAMAGGLLVLAGGEHVAEPGWVAVEPETGETVWNRRDLPVWGLAHESQTSGLLVAFHSGTGELIAVRPVDGSVIWQAALEESVDVAIVRSGRLIAVRAPGGSSVHVLDVQTGTRRGTIVPHHEGVTEFCSGPAISSDRILMYGCGGFLLAHELP